MTRKLITSLLFVNWTIGALLLGYGVGRIGADTCRVQLRDTVGKFIETAAEASATEQRAVYLSNRLAKMTHERDTWREARAADVLEAAHAIVGERRDRPKTVTVKLRGRVK